MAWATCNDCGAEVQWRAKRGTRLADLRCRCGGTLRGVVRDARSRDISMSIRTPEEYRHDPNLRAAFRDGLHGRFRKIYLRPIAELEALWAMWPENIRERDRQEEEARRAAFRAGEAARQRAIEALSEGRDNAQAASDRAFEPREAREAGKVEQRATPEAARAHLGKIAETLGINPEPRNPAVSATRDGIQLTVATADWTRVYRFPSPLAAETVQKLLLANAAENRDWIRWWFDLSVEQCGGRLLEESPARPAALVTAVRQGGENEGNRKEKPENVRREVNGMARLQVKNMHHYHSEQHGNLRAVCSLQVGDWVIHGVRVVEGKNGPFVSLPGREVKGKDGEKTYQDIAHPVTKEGREQLNKAVLDAYHQGLSQQQEQAQEQVAER